jgi:hypothetical protein
MINWVAKLQNVFSSMMRRLREVKGRLREVKRG